MIHLVRGRIWTPIRVFLPQTRSCLDHRASSGSGDSEEDVVSLPVPNASICQACAKRLINFDHSICPKDSDTYAQKKRCDGSVSQILMAGVSGDEDFRSLFFSSSELYIWFDFCKQRQEKWKAWFSSQLPCVGGTILPLLSSPGNGENERTVFQS